MIANVFWNLVFLFDLAGCIALALYALARWPVIFTWLARASDILLIVCGPVVIMALIVGFVWARLTEWNWRNN